MRRNDYNNDGHDVSNLSGVPHRVKIEIENCLFVRYSTCKIFSSARVKVLCASLINITANVTIIFIIVKIIAVIIGIIIITIIIAIIIFLLLLLSLLLSISLL